MRTKLWIQKKKSRGVERGEGTKSQQKSAVDNFNTSRHITLQLLGWEKEERAGRGFGERWGERCTL